MWSAALKILKDNWRSLLVVTVLVGGGVWFGMYITSNELDKQALAFSQEKQKLTDDFNTQKGQWDKERISAASNYAADLLAALNSQKAWQDKADALSRQLAKKEQEHTRTVSDLKRRLNDALESDGGTYTGTRLEKQAFSVFACEFDTKWIESVLENGRYPLEHAPEDHEDHLFTPYQGETSQDDPEWLRTRLTYDLKHPDTPGAAEDIINHEPD